MKAVNTIVLCAALAASLSAHARGVAAVDVPRISNGGTGFIGVTESAHTPRRTPVFSHADAASRTPMAAGEASTMVGGQPNRHPELAGVATAPAASVHVMGAASAWTAARHPLWGTPD